MASPEGFPYDRLPSQWAVVCRTAEGDRIVSHGRYADEVAALRNLPPVPMRSKKGLGGFYAGDYTSDLDDLGITSATVNVSPVAIHVRCRPQRPAWSNTPTAAKPTISTPKSSSALDATLRETAARDITVAAILLVDPAAEALRRRTRRPAATPRLHAGNLHHAQHDHPQGRARLRGDDRFPRAASAAEDDAYGRIAHWIVHNEDVDGGVDWTNMGDDKLVTTYTNAYVKSMRLCASIVRQYDANAEFFASFSHSWSRASNPGWYPSARHGRAARRFQSRGRRLPLGARLPQLPETISDPVRGANRMRLSR
ncbi:DUF5722 domain-containing protein [Alistipes putredinis]|uniref:DUF5722 domain-containing protein n=1 Tax=Alistipes putredinis TaxID=28117 RepID=UPI00399492CF